MAVRPRARRYLVVTNGEVTEGEYFSLLADELGHRAVFTARSKAVDPQALVRHAKKLHDAEVRKDEDGFAGVLVVTDVDYFNASQLSSAQSGCNEHGFRLVLSNPCFEVWLIDHVEQCSCVGTDEAKARAAKLGLVTGKNNKHIVRNALRGHFEEALANAAGRAAEERAGLRTSLGTTDFAPWTDMLPIVEEIKEDIS